MELRTNTILMGMKHSGKTTLGRMLARGAGREFNDLDDGVLNCYDGPESTIRDIYRITGKDGFMALEAQAARELSVPHHELSYIVISLGGGTIENPAAIQVLSQSARFIYLHEAEHVLFRRIIKKGVPPFLSADDPEGSFHELYNRRHRLYQERADLVVHKFDTSVDEAFVALITALEEAGYVGQ